MARYPGAVWKPVGWANASGRKRPSNQPVNRANWHTAVSNAKSLKDWFEQGSACSHFYVAQDGTVEQYIDTAYMSAADLDGNDATISVETWDGWGASWTGGPVPPLNAAQLQASISLWAWIRETHDLPNVLATTSLRDSTSRGLSTHRLGIDPWRVSGGMLYSSARGKECPGDAKIAQMPQIRDGKPGPAPTPPTPTPPPSTGIAVDGYNGSGSITRYQQIAGTEADGVISSPSDFTRWLQGFLKSRGFKGKDGKVLAQDGYGFRPNVPSAVTSVTNTDWALQNYLETLPAGRDLSLVGGKGQYVGDGTWSRPSIGVKIMQFEANAGRLFK